MTTQNRKQMRACEGPLQKILEAVDEIYASGTRSAIVVTRCNHIRGEVRNIARKLKVDLTGGGEWPPNISRATQAKGGDAK